MPLSDYKKWAIFAVAMGALGYIDTRLAMWTIGAVAVVTVLRNPQLLGG